MSIESTTHEQRDSVAVQRLVRELYEALAFVRPLTWAIAEDGGEPKWRRERAQVAIGKIDAAMVAADSLPNSDYATNG